MRLLIPFVFSVLFIVPPQPYLAYLKQHPDGRIIDFIVQYFLHIQGDFTGYTGFFTPAHLWFVLYLYLYSITSVPVFLLIVKHSEKLSRFFSKHLFLLLYPIVIGLSEQLPTLGNKNPFYYYTYFIIGFIIVSHPEIEKTFHSEKCFALFLGILTMIVYLSTVEKSFTFPKYSPEDVLFYILRRFHVWFWLIFIFGYGCRYLNFPSRFLPYLSEMSYPFYILHQTTIIIIAYFILCWNLNIWVIFILLVVFSFCLTLAIYHFIIRKYKVLRFLFGMKD